MFMIEPLYWMFKTDNFKEHFLYLLKFGAISYFLAFLIQFLLMNYIGLDKFVLNIMLQVVSIVLFVSPGLLLSGYFWCLTDNIIDREQIARANDVYDGHVNFANKIKLPDLQLGRLLWRGIASIVATIILCLPLAFLIYLFATNFDTILQFWQLDYVYSAIIGISMFVIIAFVVPALLWNYARRDSVFAVLNIFKASYIISSYPLKYFTNVFLFIVYTVVQAYVVNIFLGILGFSAIIASLSLSSFSADLSGALFGVSTILLIALTYLINIFWIYVNSYLLGTIAPPSEY